LVKQKGSTKTPLVVTEGVKGFGGMGMHVVGRGPADAVYLVGPQKARLQFKKSRNSRGTGR